MDKRKLSQEQLQEVYAFCKRKDIQYLELRMELVDHIASRIESLWEDQPELSFKDAFHKVYKSFGIFGLSEVAEEHNKLVLKRFYREAWQELLNWFRVPQIFATLSGLFGLYFLLDSFPKLAVLIFYGILATIFAVFIYAYVERRRMRKALDGDLSITMGSLYQWGWLIYFFYFIPFQNLGILNTDSYSDLLQWIEDYRFVALFYCLLTFILCLSSIKLVRKGRNQIEALKQKQSFYKVV